MNSTDWCLRQQRISLPMDILHPDVHGPIMALYEKFLSKERNTSRFWNFVSCIRGALIFCSWYLHANYWLCSKQPLVYTSEKYSQDHAVISVGVKLKHRFSHPRVILNNILESHFLDMTAGDHFDWWMRGSNVPSKNISFLLYEIRNIRRRHQQKSKSDSNGNKHFYSS